MKMKLSNPLLSRSRLLLLNVGAVLMAFSMTSAAVAGENTYNIVAAAKVEVEAQGCDYLGEVWGAAGGKLSKWNRYSANSSRHKAEDKALKMAAERNATHIVWNEHSGGSDSHQEVHALAYRCGNGEKPSDIAKQRNSTGNNSVN